MSTPLPATSSAKDVQRLRERRDIEHALRAGIPILYVETFEEYKLMKVIRAQFEQAEGRTVTFFQWTQTQGLRERATARDGRVGLRSPIPDTAPLRQALLRIEETAAKLRPDGTEAVFFFLLDPPIGERAFDDFSWEVRKLRDLAGQLRSTLCRIVLVCPNMRLPLQLTRDLQRISLPLPNEEELGQVLEVAVLQEAESLRARGASGQAPYDRSERQYITRAALGLTESQAGDTFAKSSAALGRIDAKYVVAEKEKLIKGSSNDILEFCHPREALGEVCGIEQLQQWLRDIERTAMTDQARARGLEFPKGMLLIGIPGCGKSMTVKAVGNTWNLPLIRMDIQRAFSKYIGETESHIDAALRFVEVIAPCVLWIDEVEKGFAGQGSDNTGTTTRIFGKFLTWMQEREAPVFLCCTANRLDGLPPEFTRPGRFTKIWFLGWPNADARRQLFRVHLERAFARHPAGTGVGPLLETPGFQQVVDGTNEWTGAEVELVCQSLLRRCELRAQEAAAEGPDTALREARAALSLETLLELIRHHRPMSITHRDQIETIKQWIKNHDVARAGEFEGADAFEFVDAGRRVI